MKIMKFGGTSISSAANILNVKRIVNNESGALVLVISAFGGVTDRLIQISQMALAVRGDYLLEFNSLKQEHFDIIEQLHLPTFDTLVQKVAALFEELENILKGVSLVKDLSQRTSDKVVSYGERLSTLILSEVFADFQLVDATHLIKTVSSFHKHIPDIDTSSTLIKNTFAQSDGRLIVAGFISSCKNSGEITTLGRGGSDYTAAIFASALDAETLEIWTNVDGFMTADPKIIKSAYVIDYLSYTEATELCNFGARIIYPPTIFPVYHKNIPIHIKNTFNPSAPGTFIAQAKNPAKNKRSVITGISSIDDTCLITLQGLGMVGIIGVNNRIFSALAKNGVSVFLVSQASSENSTSIGVRTADAELAVRALEDEFANDIKLGSINRALLERNLATISVVGEDMKYTPGIAGKLFSALGKSGISVIACAQGASEVNISFVIRKEYLNKALNTIHDSFFLSQYKVLNLFIVGVGTVGGSLIDQIARQQEQLMKNNSLRINVIGIARSNQAIFDENGIDLHDYLPQLNEKGVESNPGILCDTIIGMNLYNSVVVDCTASADIAALYEKLLNKNVSVVTANKIAAASNYEHYRRLKALSRDRNVKFRFETNVGAGLPVINTMNSLINSGDTILRIEAVLSGSLNYIFNTLSNSVSFSQAVQKAVDAGYAEPDPRIDLSGMDVVRKLVILVREAGYHVEIEDVERNLFIPVEYFDKPLEEFNEELKNLDSRFEETRKALEKENKRLRFVAKYSDGKCSVGLQAVDSAHPFYHLEGSNNIIQFTTERYYEYPMVIKGYGAGAAVTAAGVFADIISIANVR